MNNALDLFLNRLISTRTLNVAKAIATVLISAAGVSHSQSFVPSQQQIEQFKNLPRAQQEQLAKQMGFDMSMLEGAKSGSKSNKQESEIDFVERELDGKVHSKTDTVWI